MDTTICLVKGCTKPRVRFNRCAEHAKLEVFKLRKKVFPDLILTSANESCLECECGRWYDPTCGAVGCLVCRQMPKKAPKTEALSREPRFYTAQTIRIANEISHMLKSGISLGTEDE